MSIRPNAGIPGIHVFVYSGRLTTQPAADDGALCGRLPAVRRERLDRLQGIEERAVQLASLRLLERAMHRCGYESFRLLDVRYPENGKPYWPGATMEFSLSHARGIALCAIGDGVRVGVDAEEVQAVTPSIVARISSPSASCLPELTASNAAARWSQIEAIAKAAGLGVFRGTDIQWSPSVARLNERNWYWQSIDIDSRYSAYVATDDESAPIKVVTVEDL